MTTLTEQAADAAIITAATTLALPTVRTQAGEIADAAARAQLTHRAYLAELLSTEVNGVIRCLIRTLRGLFANVWVDQQIPNS